MSDILLSIGDSVLINLSEKQFLPKETSFYQLSKLNLISAPAFDPTVEDDQH